MSTSSESTVLLRCPNCNGRIVVQRPTLEIVILQRALIVRAGHVFAVCSQCRDEVAVPSLEFEAREIFVSKDETKNYERNRLRLNESSVKITPSESQTAETQSPKG